jgi:16S rRNA (uracil1498-N3)-methyltransferase
VPAVEPPCRWDEALARVNPDAAKFCLYERASEPLAPALLEALSAALPLAFAVGPEGGLEEAEVARASESGWRVSSLGSHLLRTETVAAAILGAARVWSALF